MPEDFHDYPRIMSKKPLRIRFVMQQEERDRRNKELRRLRAKIERTKALEKKKRKVAGPGGYDVPAGKTLRGLREAKRKMTPWPTKKW